MALPTDSITRTKAHAATALLQDAYNSAMIHRPDIVEGYFTAQYGHTPSYESLTVAERKLAAVGAIMGVSWDTNAATTEAAIVTAVQALVA